MRHQTSNAAIPVIERINRKETMMHCRYRNDLTHFREVLRAVSPFEALEKSWQSFRWRWKMTAHHNFAFAQCAGDKPDFKSLLWIFYPQKFLWQATAELPMQPNSISR